MLASKAYRTRISVRKEFIEQTRLRLGFERKLRLQMQTLFAETGSQARNEYRSAGRLTRTAPDLANKCASLLTGHYRAVIDAFGLRILRQRKAESEFEVLIQQYVTEIGSTRITQISNTTMNQIRRVILAGEKEALGVQAIADSIFESQRGTFSKYRSATIARTETHGAASYANHEVNASLEIPNQKKRWVATADLRTRSTHAAANGTEVELDEDFIVGGVAMGYTGDPRGGAKNVINCRCVTLYVTPEDDVFVDDDTPVAQKPIKEPLPERNRNSPIEPAVSLATLKVIPLKQVRKELDDQLQEASKDTRYVNTGFNRYRGSLKDFGAANLSSSFLDETASTINAIKPELDEICDRFGIPRIRGFKTITAKTTFASMGDGVMNLNVKSFNRFGSRIRNSRKDPAEIARDVEAVSQEIDEIIKQMDANSLKQGELFDQMGSRDLDLETRVRLRAEYIALGKAGKRLFNKKQKLINQRSDLRAEVELKTSNWSPDDGIKSRPDHLRNYLADPMDRMRQVLYHELGHHIHQEYKVKIREGFEDLPQSKLNWTRVTAPVDAWLDRSSTRTLLTKGENAAKTWSNYGNTNGHEWFAENFSFYWMGIRDKVDPRFITLMDNMLEGKDINDQSL